MFRCFADALTVAACQNLRPGRRVLLYLVLIGLSSVAPAQQVAASVVSQAAHTSRGDSSPEVPRSPGSIGGTVEDPTGATLAGALVTFIPEDADRTQRTQSDSDGAFRFSEVQPGAYKITVAAPGVDLWTTSGVLEEGQALDLAEIPLSLTSVSGEVEVRASSSEVAQAQLALEEKQRVLGVFPNFYATYIWDAAPLTTRQKFSLAWRFSVDPVAFAMTGVVAGSEQSSNGFSGYGQGARGYAKRFGASYADGFSSTMLGQAILPAVFHQDPRYFVKGTGSVPARALYAVATTVICKGDNQRWQLNYSNILGNAASAGISNLYYPSTNRHGAGLTIQNSLITTASGAVGGLIQEFFLHRMTPNIPDYDAARRK